MRLRVQVRGVRGLAANFFRGDRQVRADLRRVTDQHGHEQDALTAALCPFKTGRTLRLKTLSFSPDGLTYSIAWTAAAYHAEGAYFYLPIVVHGSRAHPQGNPFPYTAAGLVQPRYRRAARTAVRGALRRSLGGGVR